MTDSPRLDSLELKCMDLENTVQALNDQVIRQYRDIERFMQDIQRLEARVDALQNAAPEGGGAAEVPPHY